MASLTEVKEAMLAQLELKFPEIKQVSAFSGELDFSSLSLKAVPTTALFLAFLDAVNIGAADSLDLQLLASYGAFLIVRNQRNNLAREDKALALAEKIVLFLHGNNFNVSIGSTRVLALAQVGEPELEKAGISMWVINFKHEVFLNA